MRITIVGSKEDGSDTLRINADHIVSLDPGGTTVGDRSSLGVYLVTAPGCGLPKHIFVPEPLAGEVMAWWDTEALMFGGVIAERAEPAIRRFPGEVARREINSPAVLYALLADMTTNETGDLQWALHYHDMNPSEILRVRYHGRAKGFVVNTPMYPGKEYRWASVGYAGDFIRDTFGDPQMWTAIGTEYDWTVNDA